MKNAPVATLCIAFSLLLPALSWADRPDGALGGSGATLNFAGIVQSATPAQLEDSSVRRACRSEGTTAQTPESGDAANAVGLREQSRNGRFIASQSIGFGPTNVRARVRNLVE